jgi:hypothetical protein
MSFGCDLLEHGKPNFPVTEKTLPSSDLNKTPGMNTPLSSDETTSPSSSRSSEIEEPPRHSTQNGDDVFSYLTPPSQPPLNIGTKHTLGHSDENHIVFSPESIMLIKAIKNVAEYRQDYLTYSGSGLPPQKKLQSDTFNMIPSSTPSPSLSAFSNSGFFSSSTSYDTLTSLQQSPLMDNVDKNIYFSSFALHSPTTVQTPSLLTLHSSFFMNPIEIIAKLCYLINMSMEHFINNGCLPECLNLGNFCEKSSEMFKNYGKNYRRLPKKKRKLLALPQPTPEPPYEKKLTEVTDENILKDYLRQKEVLEEEALLGLFCSLSIIKSVGNGKSLTNSKFSISSTLLSHKPLSNVINLCNRKNK